MGAIRRSNYPCSQLCEWLLAAERYLYARLQVQGAEDSFNAYKKSGIEALRRQEGASAPPSASRKDGDSADSISKQQKSDQAGCVLQPAEVSYLQVCIRSESDKTVSMEDVDIEFS